MITDADLHALAALAEAATPGPWTAEDGDGMPGYDGMANVYGAPEEMGTVDRPSQRIARVTYTQEDADAVYIAAASPDVVRELIERVIKAEALAALAADMTTWIEGCDSEQHRPGCPKFDNDYASTCTCEADEGNIQRVRLLDRWRRAVEAGR